jgi:transcriptional regulator with XRE-family HTH domain
MIIQNLLQKLNETMTDKQIAAEIGADQSVVCRLRNGIHKTTFYERAKRIEALAKAKGIDV